MKNIPLLLIAINISIIAFPQQKTGFGNVTDLSGREIPNAIVRITPFSDTTTVYEYVCDKNGNYSFDFTSAESNFTFNIFPSAQTLQFTFNGENINLSNGNNGIVYHKVATTNTAGIRLIVVDSTGNPVQGAKVLLYDSKRKWRVDSCAVIKPVYTDSSGQVEINSLLPIEYWFNIKKGSTTNRFTGKSTNGAIDTSAITIITDTIRDLSQNEIYMCGLCDNKTWITDSMVIFGITQPYDADSKLLSDATWFDSNGNHGFWWFNPGETTMTYDYDSNSTNGGGSVVNATLIELTDSTFAGNMTMLGLPVTYYMSVQYDTVSLQLEANDTTLYLDNSGTAGITPDDLILNSSYCFTCNTLLNQTIFDTDDIGNVEVYINQEDGCGNLVADTFTVTVMAPLSVNNHQRAEIKFFPNPADDYLELESDGKNTILDISDIRGIQVRQINLRQEGHFYNISDLRPGMYFVRIQSENNSLFVEKLIVQ